MARAAAVVSAATLASRILGFLRDLVIARAFGAGAATDAFFVAFRLPNLLRRLVAEGALSSAFIPVFTEHVTTRSRAETLRMLRVVTGMMLLILGGLSLLGILAAPWVVRVMAPGFFADPAAGQLTVRLTRLMFPYLFLVGLSALAMGVLNAHRHFLLPALSPVALNIGIIIGAVVIAPRLPEPVVGLGVGVLLGGLGQLLLQVPWLAKRRLLATPRIDFRHPAVRRILGLMAPVVVGQSATHIGTVINTIIASFLAKGSVSYLYYADRLIEFPLGVFGVAIATAVLPTLSEQAARRDKAALRETVSFALRLVTFVSMPAAVGLFVLSEPIVRVLYERGRFGPAETVGTAAAVAMYALGIVGSSIAKILAQAFFAHGRHAHAGEGLGVRDGLQLHARLPPRAVARPRRARARHRRRLHAQRDRPDGRHSTATAGEADSGGAARVAQGRGGLGRPVRPPQHAVAVRAAGGRTPAGGRVGRGDRHWIDGGVRRLQRGARVRGGEARVERARGPMEEEFLAPEEAALIY